MRPYMQDLQGSAWCLTRAPEVVVTINIDHFVLPSALSSPRPGETLVVWWVGEGRRTPRRCKRDSSPWERGRVGHRSSWKGHARRGCGFSQDEHLALGCFYSYAFSIIFMGWCVDVCWKDRFTWISLKPCSLSLSWTFFYPSNYINVPFVM